jgi:hypothetical protein
MVYTHMAESIPRQTAPPSTSGPNPSPYSIGVELARDPVQAELAFMEDADASTYESSKRTTVISKESSLEVNGTPVSAARLTDERPGRNGAVGGAQRPGKSLENLPSVKEGEVIPQEFGGTDGWRHLPLKESVGHTKKEVLVGALSGILIALLVHPFIQ